MGEWGGEVKRRKEEGEKGDGLGSGEINEGIPGASEAILMSLQVDMEVKGTKRLPYKSLQPKDQDID